MRQFKTGEGLSMGGDETIIKDVVRSGVDYITKPDIDSSESVFKKLVLDTLIRELHYSDFFKKYFSVEENPAGVGDKKNYNYRLDRKRKDGTVIKGDVSTSAGFYSFADNFVKNAFEIILDNDKELRDFVNKVNNKDSKSLESLEERITDIRDRIFLVLEAELTKDVTQFNDAKKEFATLPLEDVRTLVDSMDDIKE